MIHTLISKYRNEVMGCIEGAFCFGGVEEAAP